MFRKILKNCFYVSVLLITFYYLFGVSHETFKTRFSFVHKETNVKNKPTNTTNTASHNVKVHNNYYDVNLGIKADKNELNNLNDLNIQNMMKNIQSKIKNQIKEVQDSKTTQNPQSKNNSENFKDSCNHVVFSGNVVDGVSYPKMYFRKDNLKNNNKINYYTFD